MKVKRLLLCAAAATLMLCGCSAVTVDKDGTAVISEANVKISLPAGWDIFTGGDIYEKTYSRTDGSYGSAGEMKKALEESGERYLVYAVAPDESALALFSAQSLGDTSVSAEELARATHNSTVFDFRANGYYTESSLTEETLGGVSGRLSDIKVFEKEGEPVLFEQKEFLFESGENVYSLKMFADFENIEQMNGIGISSK